MKRTRFLRFTAAVLLVLLLPLPAALASQADAGDGPVIEIRDRADLIAMREQPDGNYLLMNDIDMQGMNWYPLHFSGVFDGGGHTISNLHIVQMNMLVKKSVDGNHRGYQTYFAGFFASADKAVIRDLHLVNESVGIRTKGNCFAAGLVGWSSKTEITGCSVSGRITLYVSGKMCGVAGIMGYGDGTVTDCETDVTLVLVDENREVKCEEFLGGVQACGYADIENCLVKLDGYASVHGYVHNGGIVGMHHIHPRDKKHVGYIRGCQVDGSITFFEDNDDRRAYCKAYVGEKLNEQVVLSNNTTIRFDSIEVKEFDTPLLPQA